MLQFGHVENKNSFKPLNFSKTRQKLKKKEFQKVMIETTVVYTAV